MKNIGDRYMMRKSMCIFLCLILLTIIWPLARPINENKGSDEEWYYYPSYSNYAPSGIPDFDQKQNNWKDTVYDGWTFCGAVSVANIFWYLDSCYSNSLDTPGDGKDIFPLVLDYNAQGSSNPGPFTDDHNYNNANDLSSNWDQKNSIFGNELIERIAWYVDTNGCRTGEEIWGTPLLSMYEGISRWLENVGLLSYFQIDLAFPSNMNFINDDFQEFNPKLKNMFDNFQGELYSKADIDKIQKISSNQIDLTFENIASLVTNGAFVVLGINSMDDEKNIYLSHWVTIAGINTALSQIALSDPYFDRANYTNDTLIHNNAAIVSHDIYLVNSTSPFPEDGNFFWLEDYLQNLYSIVPAALIITPLNDNIPQIPLISFFIKPDEKYLFINDKHIIPTLFGNTVIFGDITFEANAFSSDKIDKIEFYINDYLILVDDVFPYEWFWSQNSFGLYNIKIIAVDSVGNLAENNMKVWKFF